MSIYHEHCEVLIENSPFMAPTHCKSCKIFRRSLLVMASHADLVNLTDSLPLSLYTESPVPSQPILLDRLQRVSNMPQGKF